MKKGKTDFITYLNNKNFHLKYERHFHEHFLIHLVGILMYTGYPIFRGLMLRKYFTSKNEMILLRNNIPFQEYQVCCEENVFKRDNLKPLMLE